MKFGEKISFFEVMLVIVFFLVLLFVVSWPFLLVRSVEDVVFHVKKTERVMYSRDESMYLVWSKEGEVFKNTDSLVFLKFNSSDVQWGLDPGVCVHAIVAGWRINVISEYRNIISVKECE